MRERRGVTSADASRVTGISPGTPSRMETGRRKPTPEVVLQPAKERGVALDESAGTVPALAAEPRGTVPRGFGDDEAALPLPRYVGGLHVHKHVLPAVEKPSGRPR